MSETIQCDTHGERRQTFVCAHLLGESIGLGFNCDEPTPESPFPDAWCDDCELIYRVHNCWTHETQKLVNISLLCSGCYERARIRNTKPTVTLDNLASLRWKCFSCEDWHTGPCLDFGYASPYYWTEKLEEENRRARLIPPWSNQKRKSFLNEDYCVIEGRDFFVRGVIHLPIIGAGETFRWGVWGSLSKLNFEALVKLDSNSRRAELSPMFSWLSSQIPEYPETLNLKMYAHIQEPGKKPQFELELNEHPLAQEYHKGISPERVKQIMMARLRES